MRFLVDECTGLRVALWLREQGHEIFPYSNRRAGWKMTKFFKRHTQKTGF
jgi:hypothetical protein